VAGHGAFDWVCGGLKTRSFLKTGIYQAFRGDAVSIFSDLQRSAIQPQRRLLVYRLFSAQCLRKLHTCEDNILCFQFMVLYLIESNLTKA
jgi:hypothetical protein